MREPRTFVMQKYHNSQAGSALMTVTSWSSPVPKSESPPGVLRTCPCSSQPFRETCNCSAHTTAVPLRSSVCIAVNEPFVASNDFRRGGRRYSTWKRNIVIRNLPKKPRNNTATIHKRPVAGQRAWSRILLESRAVFQISTDLNVPKLAFLTIVRVGIGDKTTET